MAVSETITPYKVKRMQEHCDFHSSEDPRYGEDVVIDDRTFLFTDIKDSTALFSKVGDVKAYHLLREHFELLNDVITANNGTIVKTTGDGIHSAFTSPADALRAALEVQRTASAFDTESRPDALIVRIGLHSGRSISCTLRDQTDYYGTAVNLAARLEGEGKGGDIVMSSSFIDEPKVKQILQNYRLDKKATKFKGFDNSIDFHVISAESLNSPRD